MDTTGTTDTSEMRRGKVTRAVLVAIPVVIAGMVACSSANQSANQADSSADTTATTITTTVPEDLEMEAADFVRLDEMTPVRGFFIDNPLGYLDEALAVANNPEGGDYPVGTIIQLIPQEAMVKRAPGFDPDSNDWEFFELQVDSEGTTINVRGGSEVVNQFGGSCAACHSKAEPQFDFVCEKDHGCDPLPEVFNDDVIMAVQQADPRPPRAR